MKGFTLVEIALVILTITILTAISFKFTVFQGDTLYLKNFIYKFGSNLNLIKDFSLGRRLIDNQKICGYGILLEKDKYFGYVFATSSYLSCDYIASNTPTAYAPSSPLLYLHTNGEIRQDIIEPLVIKDNFKTGPLNYIRVSLNDPNCSNDLFSSYSQLAFIYYNPYGDLLLLAKDADWNNLNWQNIYFCFKYKNENRYLRINLTGQAFIENP